MLLDLILLHHHRLTHHLAALHNAINEYMDIG